MIKLKAIEILIELKKKDIWDRQRAYLPNDDAIDEALTELQQLERLTKKYSKKACHGCVYHHPSERDAGACDCSLICTRITTLNASDHYTPKG